MDNQLVANRYRLLNEIGQGGTGVIYLAEDMNLRKQVVLKRIKISVRQSLPDRNEVDLLKNLYHSNLPQVYDFLQIGNEVFTVVQFINGHDLTAWVRQDGKGTQLPEQTLQSWLWQLCDVLDYLHTRCPPIIHSDIKPGNIMITPEGRAMLIDFNISFLADENVKGYSNWYASPEQFQRILAIRNGDSRPIPLDGRSDLYSLAATFYHILSGHPPQLQQSNPPLTGMKLPYSQGLLAILDKAMSPDPHKRFHSARQMRQALLNFDRYSRQYRRRVWLQVTIGAVSLMLITAGTMCLAVGQQKNVQSTYDRLYQQVVDAGRDLDQTNMIQRGLEFVRAEDIAGLREKNPVQTAEVYAVIAEGYFQQQQYMLAATYYSDALACSEEGDYALRYVVSLARSGALEEAERALEQYRERISVQAVSIVGAEFACQQGDYQTALDMVAAAERPASADEQIAMYETGILAAQALQQWGTGAEYMELCYRLTGDNYYLQRLAETCYLAGQTSTRDGQRQWYEKALAAYETLNEKYSAITENQLWEAVLEYRTGDYISARDHLLSLREETEDAGFLFRIYMYLAFITHDEDSGNTGVIRNYCEYAVMYFNQTDITQRQETTSIDIQYLAELARQYGCQYVLEG